MCAFSNEIIAIVMAGGFGQRLNLGKSKALLSVDNKPLYIHCIEQLMRAGIYKIYLICDSILQYEEYLNYSISNPFVCVYKQIKSYGSTFLILKEFLRINPISDKIIFSYGHAPRPACHFSDMIKSSSDIVLTQFPYSSKRNKIRGIDGMYIEPPYLINAELIDKSNDICWHNFFSNYSIKNLMILVLNAPNEFNFVFEFLEYSKYINNDYKYNQQVKEFV